MDIAKQVTEQVKANPEPVDHSGEEQQSLNHAGIPGTAK
jgi:hypothetical protein